MGKSKNDDVKRAKEAEISASKPDEIISDPRKKHVGLTEEEIAEALRHFLGLKAATAEFLGCSESNLHARISRSPYLKEVIHEITEKRHDDYELALHKLIIGGNFQAVWKYLTTHCKHRGYVETYTNQYSPEMLNKFLESMNVIKTIQESESALKIENNRVSKTDMS